MSEVIEANNHSVDARAFRKALIEWGRKNFRPFPWRLTDDPYHILIAEAMLQRTQARQVVSIYKQFIETYPDVRSLAKASKEELHDSLYSLGLRWRIDLIRDLASRLIGDFNGSIPKGKEDLLSLPGISEYNASALRCFAWNIAEPLVDTNTVRVVGRMFGLEIKDSSRRNRQFRELLEALLDVHDPRSYNYALLDLASQVCTKRKPPDCNRCPVSEWCVYS